DRHRFGRPALQVRRQGRTGHREVLITQGQNDNARVDDAGASSSSDRAVMSGVRRRPAAAEVGAVGHEAVELFLVAGLAQVAQELREGATLLLELAPLLIEPAQRLGAIVVEGGIAGRRPGWPAIAAKTAEVSLEAPKFLAHLLARQP